MTQFPSRFRRNHFVSDGRAGEQAGRQAGRLPWIP